MSEEFRIMGFRELEKFYEENGYYADQDPRNAMNFFDTDTPERRMERINKELEERKAIDVKEDTGGLLDALPMSKEEGMKRRKEIKDEDINKAIEKGTMARAAKGGSMSKQMELFDEGGLKDEGGTVDPVSGNEVPPGSTQEEVRDDIPAQLSEGEFVFPADVVRYLGLEFLMNLRQRAKAGLKKMEEMGQMGNSDEATLPDDIPFTVDDLEMAEGGVVEAQAGTYVAPSIPVGRVDLQNQTQQMMPPQTQQINTPGVRTVGMAQPFRATSEPYAPTSYQQFLGPSAKGAPETETRVYKHPDGRIRNVLVVKATGLPVIPGAIEDAIKDGFVFEPQPLKEEVKVEPIKQQTSKVEPVSGDGGDSDKNVSSATISFGGTPDPNKPGLQKNAITANISYNVKAIGTLGIFSGLGTIADINKGKDVETTGNKFGLTTNPVDLSYGAGKPISVTSTQYATIKNNTMGVDAVNLKNRLETLDKLGKNQVTFDSSKGTYVDVTGKEISVDVISQAGKDISDHISQEVSKGRNANDIIAQLNSGEIDALMEHNSDEEDRDRSGAISRGVSAVEKATGKSLAQLEEESRRAVQQQSDDSPSDDGGVSQETQDTFGDTGEADFDPVAKGSLITKRKASGKIKKKYMKRGGLASKK